MSQNKLCTFWCLLDGEEEAFTAEAGLDWEVDELAKAIRQEKAELRAHDASKIVLHKVRLPSYLPS